VVTDDISRKVYEGKTEPDMTGSSNTNYNFVTVINGHPADNAKISEAIDTSRQDNLNRTFMIEYTAEDKRDEKYPKLEPNSATLKRRFIMKDTTNPRLVAMDQVFTGKSYRNTIPTRTLELDYLEDSPFNKNKRLADGSTMNVLVNSEVSVKEYIAKIFSVEDFDQDFDYDETKELKWSIEISPAYKGNVKYPDSLDIYKSDPQSGYTVRMSVTDESGNISDEVELKLAVIDATPPEIYLLGDAEIHDFYRFGPNDSDLANVQELPFPDRNADDPSNTLDPSGNPISYIPSGFTSGEHRMLLSKYNFIDPGVYAEDFNGDFHFSISPDLDGDGIGETHGYVLLQVDFYDIITYDKTFFVNSTFFKPGIIYVHRSLESVENEQIDLSRNVVKNEQYEETVAVSNAEITSGGVPINVKKTTFTFSYLIKDSWDNVPEVTKIRRVHIYESEQLPDYAFYATPIVNGVELASYYDTNGSSDNFLSSIRKDYDGDGVSDFWEVLLSEANSNPHLDPSSVDPGWHNPEQLNAALFQLTRKEVTIDGKQEIINSFTGISERVKVLLDGTSNADIGRKGLFTAGQGLNRITDPNPDFPANNLLILDFNKQIP
jgi:hypothetical protein